jgi:beta-N-acetylhexosaminidase
MVQTEFKEQMNDLNLRQLTLSEKIGQVIMPRLDFRDSDPLPQAEELVRRFRVGGFIVFGGERGQVKNAIRELKAISHFPLFFACDAERGLGQIVSGGTKFPFTMALGAAGDEELVYRQARFIADEMKDCGFNMIFAPVVDVNTNPDNPIINIRSYGDDPALVSCLGAAFVRGSQDAGVLACVKHFPGHGGVKTDSHITLPRSGRGREGFWRYDLIPFKEAIENGVASIMIAHLAAPRIDSTEAPATISLEIVRRLLLHDLKFKGLVITDSFYMGAVSELGREEDVAPLALLAGCDIILDPKRPIKLMERLNKMVKTEKIPESLLDDAAEKVISAKRKWLTSRHYESSSDRSDGEELRQEIARRSVCLLKGEALRSGRAMVYVLDVTQPREDASEPFFDRLTNAGISFEKRSLTLQEAKTLITEGESDSGAVICLVYTSVAAWKGHTNLPEPFERFLTKIGMMEGEKVLISFGSPYVIRGFEKFDSILCAFDRLDVCQHAAADVLLGRIEAQGKLPVRL